MKNKLADHKKAHFPVNNQVWDQVGNKAYRQIRRQVWDQVRNQGLGQAWYNLT